MTKWQTLFSLGFVFCCQEKSTKIFFPFSNQRKSWQIFIFLFEFRQTDNCRFFKRESNRRTTITITNEDQWKTKKKKTEENWKKNKNWKPEKKKTKTKKPTNFTLTYPSTTIITTRTSLRKNGKLQSSPLLLTQQDNFLNIFKTFLRQCYSFPLTFS